MENNSYTTRHAKCTNNSAQQPSPASASDVGVDVKVVTVRDVYCALRLAFLQPGTRLPYH